ncbi:MAG TPA: RusA family crossover junction endodeoxyribonuclease [Gemmataceae bacterium]|nr:RusA family crossover junction endodeoxyribonuclease [Gemmataceae bacterium]
MPVVEFTVPGPPISHQSGNKALLQSWKAQVQAEAAKVWTQPPLTTLIKCTIMNFYAGAAPPLDDDNMVKPIRDALNGLVYADDKQIRHSHHVQSSIDDRFHIRWVSMVLLEAFNAGDEFVYVRIEDAPAETQLPK